ncbi:uncharacterized protein DS421_15g508930 [Arachis hypogaea]|nr:uncharacterized protein DS421_15g508930 [Arachis hypogaea]
MATEPLAAMQVASFLSRHIISLSSGFSFGSSSLNGSGDGGSASFPSCASFSSATAMVKR